ncbi:MAG: zinc-binding dehydrogenase [Elusimicrobiota bacterium]|jgi:L-erythro-3,5-diaminohexanoate dehydrogenase
MKTTLAKKGNPFGTHRVLEPKGVLPQPAKRVDNSMDVLYDNEILADVDTLNVDSASFTQIKQEAQGDEKRIREIILRIVSERGKLQNPVTGSGGMFMGTVSRVGAALAGKCPLRKGDRIASLVSLSLTPLRIDEILEVKKDVDQVRVRGQAVLFESGIYAKLPQDIPASLALAVLDVCGAAPQIARFAKLGDTVVLIGAGGKSGLLCAYEARKRVGVTGTVIGIEYSEAGLERLKKLGFCDEVFKLDATDAAACYEKIHAATAGRLADLVVNCVNIPNTEMASILMCRERGVVYFFSMSTSFTKATLGAEGVGKDVDMIMGNGYAQGHAQITLNILRESKAIRELYEKLYA